MIPSRGTSYPTPHPTGARDSVFYRLGQVLARRCWIVIVAWTVLVGLSLWLIPRFNSSLTGPPLAVIGAESHRAQEIIEQRFESPFAERNIIVFQSDRLTAKDLAFQGVVAAATRAVASLPHVVDVVGPLDPRAVNQISVDGHVASVVIGLSGSDRMRQQLAPELTRAAESAATDQVQVYLTGRSPLIADLVEQEHEDLARAERLGLPAAMIVLLLASGTLVAAGLPILLALVGVVVTFGALGAATAFTSFNLFVPNIAMMLGLGVGIDYSLFVVTRYREELARPGNSREAVARAIATSGKMVFFSGATVLLSLASLLIVDAPILRELAVGAMMAVGVMLAGALTLVPAVLAAIGPAVSRLALPCLRRSADRAEAAGGFWLRWTSAIMRYSIVWAVTAVLVLLACTAPITQLQLGLDTGTSELQHRSSGKGREILEREFNEGSVSPIRVVVVSPDGALDDGDLSSIARLSGAFAADGGVADVVSVTELLDRFVGNHTAATLAAAADLPQAAAALGDLVNFGRGRNVTVLNVVPRDPPDSDGALQLVRRMREAIVPQATNGAGVEVSVGGLPAQIVDISDEALRKLPFVGGLVVALSFVLLALVFRSLILPLKAIAMNVLSIGAAYGLLVLVFQEGVGERIFDFTASGTTQVYLPLLTFAVLFGLSMDYEVFLLGRIKEEWEQTGDNRAAVARGLQRTGGIITSAAAVMVAVFAAFTFARLTEIKELGFSLAVAVLIDATVVRVVLVPSTMHLLGRWNWWFPPWLDKVVPRIDLDEGKAGASRATISIERPARP